MTIKSRAITVLLDSQKDLTKPSYHCIINFAKVVMVNIIINGQKISILRAGGKISECFPSEKFGTMSDDYNNIIVYYYSKRYVLVTEVNYMASCPALS